MRDARRRLRRLPHGRDRDDRARTRRRFLQRMLSNDVDQDRRGRRPVLRALPRGRRRARRPLHLPARRRPLPDRHQRVQPRDATSRGSASTPSGFDVELARPRSHDYAMLAVQGPEARGIVAGARRRRAAGALQHRRRCTVAGAPDVLVCGTGYTGEDGVELLVAPERRRRRLGRAGRPRGATPAGPRRARHAAPRGLLPPLRQRPDGDARPDRGRPRLVLQGGHGLHRRRGRRAPRARPARREARRRS